MLRISILLFSYYLVVITLGAPRGKSKRILVPAESFDNDSDAHTREQSSKHENMHGGLRTLLRELDNSDSYETDVLNRKLLKQARAAKKPHKKPIKKQGINPKRKQKPGADYHPYESVSDNDDYSNSDYSISQPVNVDSKSEYVDQSDDGNGTYGSNFDTGSKSKGKGNGDRYEDSDEDASYMAPEYQWQGVKTGLDQWSMSGTKPKVGRSSFLIGKPKLTIGKAYNDDVFGII